MADRVSARRAAANSYFLTLQTATTVVLAFFARDGSAAGSAPDNFIVGVAAGAGVLLSLAWWLLLRSYRDLNRAKFAVITNMERSYFDLRPFTDEWAALVSDPIPGLRGRYAELGAIERVVPLAFGLLYLLVAVHLMTGLRICIQ